MLRPEARLIPVWFATSLTITGVAPLGISLQHSWHYIVTAFCWGVLSSAWPCPQPQSMLTFCWPNLRLPERLLPGLTLGGPLGGFLITYFEVLWVDSEGSQTALGIQSSVIGALFFFIVILQLFGEQLRSFSGRVHFHTN